MTGVVAYPGVEDIVERVFAEEDIADDTHAATDERISPQAAQVSYRVDYLFLHSHALQEIVVVYVVFGKQASHLLVMSFDEADDSLSEVLGDILGLVFHPSFHSLSQLTFL